VSSRLDDDEVLEYLHRVMKEHRSVHTLNLLWKLVQAQIAKERPGHSVTRERLRTLAALDDGVHLDIRTREDDSAELPSICPVCTSKLSTVKNRTLYGWEVTIERTCPICGFWTGRKRRVPTYYVFSRSS